MKYNRQYLRALYGLEVMKQPHSQSVYNYNAEYFSDTSIQLTI